MGCDIHLLVEVYRKGKWHLAPGQAERCKRCNGTGKDPENGHCANCKGDIVQHMADTGKCLFDAGMLLAVPDRCSDYCTQGKQLIFSYYRGRNYFLFGVLSGVRGDSVKDFTIEDRGLPEDCDPLISAYLDNPDIHSAGHYTLEELEKYSFEADELESFRVTLRKLRELDYDPEDVRIVFGYDN